MVLLWVESASKVRTITQKCDRAVSHLGITINGLHQYSFLRRSLVFIVKKRFTQKFTRYAWYDGNRMDMSYWL